MPPGSLTPLAMSARGTVYSHTVLYLPVYTVYTVYYTVLHSTSSDFGLTFLASVPPIKIQVTFQ